MIKKQLILLFILLLVVFKSWLTPGLIAGGDLWVVYENMYQDFNFFPYAWNPNFGNGLGHVTISIPWLSLPTNLPIVIFGKLFSFGWDLIVRFGFLFPMLLICIFSSLTLAKFILKKNDFIIFTPIIFVLNTYFLMVSGGGQMFVGLAYSLSILVLFLFIKNVDSTKSRFDSILAGLILGLQMLIDIRITYITLVSIVLYILLVFNRRRFSIYHLFHIFLAPLSLSILLNAFWILPTIAIGRNPLEDMRTAYSSADAVKFFSFARLENTISLLHPNWPENIFGKTYFMRAEFLILPILAYSSLLFIPKIKVQKTKNYILFFSLLGLIGAFLAKGANEPLGIIYLWMFEHVPGFNMFRDSTKWYTLVALSYSILIPYSISKIYNWLESKNKFTFKSKFFSLQNLFILLLTSYFLLLISPALLGQLGGTFKTTSVPAEYFRLEKYISNQSEFSRTLWIPTVQRFGYYSSNHPAVSAQDYFKLYDQKILLKELSKNETEELLQHASIKYIIVPFDSEGEIFLEDREYSEDKYTEFVDQVNEISWLSEIEGFGNIKVFELSNSKDHFWSPEEDLGIKYEYINPVTYKMNIADGEKGDQIVFAESFDDKWVASNSDFIIQSSEYETGLISLNSFTLPADGDYELEVYYEPQKWVDIGVVISTASIIIVFGSLIYLKFKK
jgi:hypothetical protein